MRWFPVKLRVVFSDVVSALYVSVTLCCFFRKVITLLYMIVPSPDTEGTQTFLFNKCDYGGKSILRKVSNEHYVF